MVKKIFTMLVCFICLTIFISAVHAQGSKSITLPNGEVVWDLNGEWDVSVECYGPWQFLGKWPQIGKIRQEGNSFVSVRMLDDPYNKKGTQNLQGELDKSGIKKVQMMSGAGPLDAKGTISEDGNKIIFDDGEKVRATYTRK